MTRIRVEVGAAVAVVELKDTAVQSAKILLHQLPLTARLTHASRSGNCAIASSPELRDDGVPVEGQVSMYYPGMVAYDAKRGQLALAYGQGQARSTTGTHWVTYLGDVVEGLGELSIELQRTRDVGATTVLLTREA